MKLKSLTIRMRSSYEINADRPEPFTAKVEVQSGSYSTVDMQIDLPAEATVAILEHVAPLLAEEVSKCIGTAEREIVEHMTKQPCIEHKDSEAESE